MAGKGELSRCHTRQTRCRREFHGELASGELGRNRPGEDEQVQGSMKAAPQARVFTFKMARSWDLPHESSALGRPNVESAQDGVWQVEKPLAD